MPPPSRPARLSETRSRSKSTRVPLFSMPPPSASALFSVKELSSTFTSPWLSIARAPPRSLAWLSVNVDP